MKPGTTPFLFWLMEGSIKVTYPDGTSRIFDHSEGIVGGELNLLFRSLPCHGVVAQTVCSVVELRWTDFNAIPGILRRVVVLRQKANRRLMALQKMEETRIGELF